MQYPLGQYEREQIRSKTGKSLDDITIDAIKKGNITADDIKISKDMLLKQGEIALENRNPELASNFTRAAELVDVPDEIILDMYNKLRPNRSSKSELEAMARELKETYHAEHCAKLVFDAAQVYEKRGVLL